MDYYTHRGLPMPASGDTIAMLRRGHRKGQRVRQRRARRAYLMGAER